MKANIWPLIVAVGWVGGPPDQAANTERWS